ncbi:MAG: triose-phosphate isomerase [Deltaproteobacteria bacterium]|nr:triose-phosphate isomerase [Deltaproteobacteria bacterium]
MNAARRALISGNWKMNNGGASGVQLASDVARAMASFSSIDIVVAPPFTALVPVVAALKGTRVEVAAQNMHPKDKGAFTGEISPSMLLEAGCKWVILGHSERRAMFGDTDATVAEKTKVAMDVGLRPIVCVGETLEERERGDTLNIVKRQLNAFASIIADKPGWAAVAYEPVWAIGTGKNAGPEEAQEVHAMIRARLADISADLAAKTRILYGGSLSPKNADALLRCPDVDGGLIGGAALKAEDFSKVGEIAQSIS